MSEPKYVVAITYGGGDGEYIETYATREDAQAAYDRHRNTTGEGFSNGPRGTLYLATIEQQEAIGDEEPAPPVRITLPVGAFGPVTNAGIMDGESLTS